MWTGGQVNRWTSGQVDRWTGGHVDKWTSGQVDTWTGGQVDKTKRSNQTVRRLTKGTASFTSRSLRPKDDDGPSRMQQKKRSHSFRGRVSRAEQDPRKPTRRINQKEEKQHRQQKTTTHSFFPDDRGGRRGQAKEKAEGYMSTIKGRDCVDDNPPLWYHLGTPLSGLDSSSLSGGTIDMATLVCFFFFNFFFVFIHFDSPPLFFFFSVVVVFHSNLFCLAARRRVAVTTAAVHETKKALAI